MFAKTQISSFSKGIRILGLFVLLVAAFFATPVSAEGDEPTISVERLKGIGVGIKIVFPGNTNGDLSVFINGVKMNCEAVTPNTLYCVGPLHPNEFGNLSFYDGASQTTTFSTTVAGPASNNQSGETCTPHIAASPKPGAPHFDTPPPHNNWCLPNIF